MTNMDKYQRQPDLLEDLFKQLPEEKLPASFRTNIMRQVMQETAKAKKRNERYGLAAVILASLVMLALAVVSFIYMDIPRLTLPKIDISAFTFYLYIGLLTLILLFADYKLRKLFHKGEQ